MTGTGDTPEIVEIVLSYVRSKSSSEATELEVLNKTKLLMADGAKDITIRINAQMKAAVKSESSCQEGGNGEPILHISDAQFFEPRGRFKTSLSGAGILLEGKSASCFVSWENITHASIFPAHQTTKKEGEDLLFMHIKEDKVQYNNKPLKNLLWNMGKNPGKPLSVVQGLGYNAANPLNGTESEVISTIMQKLWCDTAPADIKRPLICTDSTLFQTVSQTSAKDAKPFLRCYKGTQEGAIYPLKNGVVFIKPVLFLPAEQIASLTAGRGGGSGQTRYVDLQIEMADEKQWEFTNIERDELPALQNYVKGYLEIRKAAEAERRAQDGGDVENDLDDSDEEEDDDFDPDADSEDEFETDSDDSEDSDASEGSDDEADEDDEGEEGEKEMKNGGKVMLGSTDTGKENNMNKNMKKEKIRDDDNDGVAEAAMKAAYQSSFIKRERDETVLDTKITVDLVGVKSEQPEKMVKIEHVP